jgi:polysaccharide deacetylase family protein (PEP-CTERM system associated)
VFSGRALLLHLPGVTWQPDPGYNRRAVLNALTIDVEEYFHAHAYERAIAPADWERLPSRVLANTRRLLDLLAAAGTRATFFVLGWVAERHPALIREITAGGHELASHGYGHQLLYRQTPDEFRADLRRSLDAIRDANGADGVLGYRAPSFSVTDETRWALDVVRELGLRYDSSIRPVSVRADPVGTRLRGGKRYGLSGMSRFATRLEGGLWEFPVSTVRLGQRNWPVGGGGYFRLLPLWATRQAIRRINHEGSPAVVYLHPWELDADEPHVPGVDWLARFRHRVNVGRTEARLKRLVAELRFAPLREVFAAELAAS